MVFVVGALLGIYGECVTCIRQIGLDTFGNSLFIEL
jgi:hypothetical protein